MGNFTVSESLLISLRFPSVLQHQTVKVRAVLSEAYDPQQQLVIYFMRGADKRVI